ncbi:MAG: YIP1 family protein [Chloroflexi bacterium]|nr:YIP1 family protein [Chloroflexota bacterium]
MAGIAATPSLTDRMLRAARVDTALYNEVEADTTATQQALMVVILVALASGIGAALSGAFHQAGTGAIVGGLVAGIVSEIVGWAVWSFFAYWVGTRVFGGTATYGELLRTLGFAYSPGVLLILRFIPILGGLIAFIVAIWRLVTSYVATREALDLDNGRTIATIIVGFIAYLIVVAIIVAILAAIGFSAAALTGNLSS